MGVSYMVRGSTEAECRRELERLCLALGAVATTEPMQASGPGWMARAVMPKTPASGEGLAEQ